MKALARRMSKTCSPATAFILQSRGSPGYFLITQSTRLFAGYGSFISCYFIFLLYRLNYAVKAQHCCPFYKWCFMFQTIYNSQIENILFYDNHQNTDYHINLELILTSWWPFYNDFWTRFNLKMYILTMFMVLLTFV